MAYTIPTTQESADQNLTSLEGNLAQTSPLNDKAFLRVLAVVEAMAMTGLYKYAAERVQQNLALTASGSDLDTLGSEYGIYRKAASYAQVGVTLPALQGVAIPSGTAFIGASNGERYTSGQAITAGVTGAAALLLTADNAGVVGNMAPGDTLTIVSQVPGAQSVATVLTLDTTGAEIESDNDYAARILFAERATQGGGNATDYKFWSEAVAGVNRAFPYSGKPTSVVDTSYPGDRTVYVEADSTIQADGIPTSALLAEVRAALDIDPNTMLSRPTLGLTPSTLYVIPISRTPFDVDIVNLVVPSGALASVQGSINSALSIFFTGLAPYVLGVDLPPDQNDTLTGPLVNQVVQDVLTATGSSAQGVYLMFNTVVISQYQLSPGELAKLGTIYYNGTPPVTTTIAPITTTGAPGTAPVSTITFSGFNLDGQTTTATPTSTSTSTTSTSTTGAPVQPTSSILFSDFTEGGGPTPPTCVDLTFSNFT